MNEYLAIILVIQVLGKSRSYRIITTLYSSALTSHPSPFTSLIIFRWSSFEYDFLYILSKQTGFNSRLPITYASEFNFCRTLMSKAWKPSLNFKRRQRSSCAVCFPTHRRRRWSTRRGDSCSSWMAATCSMSLPQHSCYQHMQNTCKLLIEALSVVIWLRLPLSWRKKQRNRYLLPFSHMFFS